MIGMKAIGYYHTTKYWLSYRKFEEKRMLIIENLLQEENIIEENSEFVENLGFVFLNENDCEGAVYHVSVLVCVAGSPTKSSVSFKSSRVLRFALTTTARSSEESSLVEALCLSNLWME